MNIKAIETVYNGYRFRSRLEARYAVMFDSMGLQYFYEHEGFELGGPGYYLPDFYFPILKCYAEVKPIALTLGEFTKCWHISDGCLLLDGLPTLSKGYYWTGWGKMQPLASSVEYAYGRYQSGDLYGRVLLGRSQQKRRLWYLMGESPSDYYLDSKHELAARQARFEHGETPRMP